MSALPVLLSFVAGYVDSCTFLGLFGLFVAQVTGSFVLIGAQLVENGPLLLARMAGALSFFFAAIATTAVIGSAEPRGTDSLPAALAVEAALLAGVLTVWLVSRPMLGPDAPGVLPASILGLSAMGRQSAMFKLLMRGSPSTNVMTRNTIQFAIDTTDFLLAWRRCNTPADPESASDFAKAKQRMTAFSKVVVGFFLGTLVGAIAYAELDLWCILLPIALVGVLSVFMAVTNNAFTNASHSR